MRVISGKDIAASPIQCGAITRMRGIAKPRFGTILVTVRFGTRNHVIFSAAIRAFNLTGSQNIQKNAWVVVPCWGIFGWAMQW